MSGSYKSAMRCAAPRHARHASTLCRAAGAVRKTYDAVVPALPWPHAPQRKHTVLRLRSVSVDARRHRTLATRWPEQKQGLQDNAIDHTPDACTKTPELCSCAIGTDATEVSSSQQPRPLFSLFRPAVQRKVRPCLHRCCTPSVRAVAARTCAALQGANAVVLGCVCAHDRNAGCSCEPEPWQR